MARLLRFQHGFSVASTVILDELGKQVPRGIFEAVRLGTRDAAIPDLLAKTWSNPNDPAGQLSFFSRKDPDQMRAELVASMFLQRIAYGTWYIMTHNYRLAQLWHRLDSGITIPLSRRLRWFIEHNQPGLVPAGVASISFRPQFLVRASMRNYMMLILARIQRAVWRALQMIMTP